MSRTVPVSPRRHAALALVFGLLGSSAFAAEQHVAQYGAPFCETLASLKPYVEGILARDIAALDPLQDCVWLKSDVRVETLKEYSDFGQGVHVVQVRMYGNGTSVDGYMLSNGFTPPLPAAR